MDDTLRNAIERRDALRRELEAWDAFIAAYSSQLAYRQDEEVARATQADLFAPKKLTRSERATAVRAMMDEAERFILQAGRPLTRFQLLRHLLDAGHKIEGGDQSKVLGTNLWRSTRFHNIQGAGYWPKSTPIPAPYDTLPLRETRLS